MNYQALLQLAIRFREAIEMIPVERRPIGMQRFPSGACGDATLLLGAYFKDQSIDGFKYICGERGTHQDNTWTSHAWLQHGNCVVDITADQFSDAPAAVIVAAPSAWHSAFTVESPLESDFRLWSGYGAELLRPMYSAILNQLSLS